MAEQSALQEFAEAGGEELGRLLLRAARAVNEEVIERLTSLGHPDIRPSHTAVFTNLDLNGTRAVTIAQRAGMTRQAMSTLIRELEDASYVVVEADPQDGRAFLVRLTALGERFCHEAAVVIRQIEAEWAERLGDPGLRLLRDSLHALSKKPSA
jgi:DNA-binding MarR family transcriptional regulator